MPHLPIIKHISTAALSLFAAVLMLAGCTSPAVTPTPAASGPAITSTAEPVAPLASLQPVKQAATEKPPALWISPDLPPSVTQDIQIRNPFTAVDSPGQADLEFGPLPENERENAIVTTRWVYALAAPFPTLTDFVSSADVRQAWRGEKTVQFPGRQLLMSPETRRIIASLWGEPGQGGIKILPAGQLLTEAWKNQPAWALIPFEELEPRWKVLTVDGLNPLEKSMPVDQYPLTAAFGFAGKQQALSGIHKNQAALAGIPPSNRDTDKMTTLVMTGTTALTRGTAERMEVKGIHYPGEKILSWLKDADLTHISNEIPFARDCPPAVPVRTDWNFCSSPAYIELLKFIGADIIELTGNHVMDWGAGDLLYTLKMYKDNGYRTYGGGFDLEDARKALLVEDHGNKLAFIGCTPPGPAYAWATDDTPGNASCDREWMASEVKRLQGLGYMVIVTYQHLEEYDYAPVPPQRGDFQFIAEAGAAIVSGSQSHFPQGMAFYGPTFMHYGLGNLFFDQMDEPVVGTRREFIDRHVFYKGRYISTQLLTAMLEDHAQPRPMTAAERKALLQDAFNASTW